MTVSAQNHSAPKGEWPGLHVNRSGLTVVAFPAIWLIPAAPASPAYNKDGYYVRPRNWLASFVVRLVSSFCLAIQTYYVVDRV